MQHRHALTCWDGNKKWKKKEAETYGDYFRKVNGSHSRIVSLTAYWKPDSQRGTVNGSKAGTTNPTPDVPSAPWETPSPSPPPRFSCSQQASWEVRRSLSWSNPSFGSHKHTAVGKRLIKDAKRFLRGFTEVVLIVSGRNPWFSRMWRAASDPKGSSFTHLPEDAMLKRLVYNKQR